MTGRLPLSERAAAFEILRRVEKEGAYSNAAANAVLADSRVSHPHGRDEPVGLSKAFVRELAYGVLKRKYLLDQIIEKHIKGAASRLDLPVLLLLRLGVYQLLFMNSVPDHAALNETMKLAKRMVPGRDKFINAVLRSVQREDSAFLGSAEEEALPPHIRHSFEEWIVKALEAETSEGQEGGAKIAIGELLDSLNERPELWLRVNRLKTEPASLTRELAAAGIAADAGAGAKAGTQYAEADAKPGTQYAEADAKPITQETLPYALRIKGDGVFSLSQYCNGSFSVQDRGSQYIVKCLGAKRGELVIDVCAAPGGKSMAIAECMGDEGRVIATDVSPRRVESIVAEARRLGLSSVETGVRDARLPDESLIGRADRVLVDAPCSGIGTARRKPEVKYRAYDERTEGLPALQGEILEAGSAYLKPGGILVYSTCTVFRRENEEVTRGFLDRHREFVIEHERRLSPRADETDGFYVCVMKKL